MDSILHNRHVNYVYHRTTIWQVCSHEDDIKGMYILATYVHIIIVTSYCNFGKIQIYTSNQNELELQNITFYKLSIA